MERYIILGVLRYFFGNYYLVLPISSILLLGDQNPIQTKSSIYEFPVRMKTPCCSQYQYLMLQSVSQSPVKVLLITALLHSSAHFIFHPESSLRYPAPGVEPPRQQ